jgi:FkbM family methyltransferase
MSLQNKIRGIKEIWSFDNRISLVLNRIFFPGESLFIYRYKGLEILTDIAGGDVHGAREVFTSPMYTRFFAKMKLSEPVNVLDLGANNGGFPLLLEVSGITIKKVVSLEFNPNTFIRLSFNLARNLAGRGVAVNAALCGEPKVISVDLGKGSASDSIYEGTQAEQSSPYSIQGVTFDQIYSEHFEDEIVDICKIDVEGAEFEVILEPAHQKLRQCRYLIMEIHERYGRKADEILPLIERLGFVKQEPDADADPTVHFFRNSAFD